ncbi:hypothetical protein M0813_18230 [Anaeramoeba flamelloides]|uniref:Uncharacterized protein n=1 Tax=Anaeramoeba flamelloides TaxID=1746091 RepID=A0ABQ8YSM3_9EUKA|nr:hypothetical protein M0813_18230 [Anaeramoeba flamelloides]
MITSTTIKKINQNNSTTIPTITTTTRRTATTSTRGNVPIKEEGVSQLETNKKELLINLPKFASISNFIQSNKQQKIEKEKSFDFWQLNNFEKKRILTRQENFHQSLFGTSLRKELERLKSKELNMKPNKNFPTKKISENYFTQNNRLLQIIGGFNHFFTYCQSPNNQIHVTATYKLLKPIQKIVIFLNHDLIRQMIPTIKLILDRIFFMNYGLLKKEKNEDLRE